MRRWVGSLSNKLPPKRFPAGLLIQLGLPGRQFTRWTYQPIAAAPNYLDGDTQGITSGDLNADGKTDLVVGGGRGSISVFWGRSDGTFEDEFPLPLPRDGWVSDVLIEDLDRDGWDDLFVLYGTLDGADQVFWGIEGGLFDFGFPMDWNSLFVSEVEPVTGLMRSFIRGDSNDDGRVSISDVIHLLRFLFVDGQIACGDASDADDSGKVELADVVRLLAHLFVGGVRLPQPYPNPGRDPTADRTNLLIRVEQDLGCSFESFYSQRFVPCPGEDDPNQCVSPWLHVIDLTPEQLKPR